MIAADIADGLVGLRRAGLLAHQPVSEFAIERERGLLQLRGTEREHRRAGLAAGLLCKLQHHAGEPAPAVGSIDVHAPKLGGCGAKPFEAEHPGKLLAVIDHEERALPLRVIVREPVDLVAQRNRHVVLKCVAQSGRCKLAIDANEKIADSGVIAVPIPADREIHFRLGASAISAPRTCSSSFSTLPCTLGNSSFSPSIASTIASAMTRRANHLLSAGTTYQRASSRLVWRIASS